MTNPEIIHDPFRRCKGELIQSNYPSFNQVVFNWSPFGWPKEFLLKSTQHTVAKWRIKSIKQKIHNP